MKKIYASILLLLTACIAFSHNLVDTISIESHHIASPAKAVVAVPADYFSDNNTENYPVVYLLHGYSDDYAYYSTKMDIAKAADDYGIIIVCPDGRDSWYWDSPIDPTMQMEGFITEELVPAIDRRYRTIDSASQRAIAGLSMGGQGSLWLAIRHPDIWGNAASMSGGVDITPEKFHAKWKMARSLGSYESNPQRWREHSITNLVKDLTPETINIYIACGTSDFFYKVNCDLDRRLNEAKIPHVYVTAPGGHSWDYWAKTIYLILDFFNANFR
ncbi:MAG: esterase family protein [Lachnoclostridium sp.]|nr:esterase family protein [Lachnoclostridium sp.]